MGIVEKIKVDLRTKPERPVDDIEKLYREFIKVTNGQCVNTKRFKRMVEYIVYLEGKLDRKDTNFKRMKKHIHELEEMTK